MRRIGLALVALAIVNASLVGLRRSASAERDRLVETAADLTERAEDARVSSERRRETDALVARARAYTEDPRDIGALRDALVGAEKGLAIDRLSLEFRPEEKLPSELGGSRVVVSLRGRFDAAYDYLQRIEAMFIPLALDSLVLRGDAESVTLTVHWLARWARADGDVAVELSPADVARLEAWLEQAPPPRPERDVFAFARAIVADVVDNVPPSESNPPGESDLPAPSEPERPVLTGFVLARPELEPDVNRRVLAALRYEGETRLVMVGDSVGAFVVDSMKARDSVTLTRADTGERIQLTLE